MQGEKKSIMVVIAESKKMKKYMNIFEVLSRSIKKSVMSKIRVTKVSKNEPGYCWPWLAVAGDVSQWVLYVL